MTPTERTLRHYRNLGYTVERVERWVQAGRGGFRKDFLGLIDFLALLPGQPPLGVQSCGKDFAGHLRKINANSDRLRLWLSTGCGFELIGWRLLRGKPTPRIQVFQLPPGLTMTDVAKDEKFLTWSFEVDSGSQNGSESTFEG